MKKKLFSIDIAHSNNNNTYINWWRRDDKYEFGCYERTIQVKTDATYKRLHRLLPPENATCLNVHPHSDRLAISWLIKE
jgi:hypothetical protein